MKSLIFLFILSFQVHAQVLKEIQVKSDKTSYELELLINHLKAEVKDPIQVENVLKYLSLINSDLKFSKRKDALFLIKSEIYRSILNYDLNITSSLLINELFLKSLEQKLNKHKLTYSDFIQWMIQSMIADIRPYLKSNFAQASNQELETQNREYKKLLKFVGPWLILFEKQTPEGFNLEINQLALTILKTLSNKTYLYAAFAVSKTDDETPLFILPNLSEVPALSTKTETKTTPQTEENAVAVPEEKVESVTNPEDLSSISGELDKINNEASSQPTDEIWVPD